jgi:hypothetical protein
MGRTINPVPYLEVISLEGPCWYWCLITTTPVKPWHQDPDVVGLHSYVRRLSFRRMSGTGGTRRAGQASPHSASVLGPT